MSVWHEKEDENIIREADPVTDVVFKMDCKSLPVDHAAILSESLCSQLPWLDKSPLAGIHPVHVAGSQNGWQRPDTEDQPLLLSKRTRLKVRVEKCDVEKLLAGLENTSHRVDQHELKILAGRISPLQPMATLFSRYTVYSHENQTLATDEDQFVQKVIGDCESVGYSPTKILSGRSNEVAYNGKKLVTRSVMLADVPLEHSINLQAKGLGDLRLIGCGILIPHKDTSAVN